MRLAADQRRTAIAYGAGILFIVLDQILFPHLHLGERVSNRWLETPGVFSWLLGLAVLLMLRWYVFVDNRYVFWWALAAAAVLSNALTHLRFNGVVDYWPVGPWVINAADLVLIGSLIILFCQFLSIKKDTREVS